LVTATDKYTRHSVIYR